MLARLSVLRWFAGGALCLALCGCTPSSQGPADEQKEPYFLTGKARVSTLDYNGAVEAFEKALEANPHNASAHYELGLLQEKLGDYAAAIYHFERYLKLRPDAPNKQIIQERISADKMELSKTALFAPVTQNLQREFEKLAQENKQLRAEVEKWRVYYARQPELAGQSVRHDGAGVDSSDARGGGANFGADIRPRGVQPVMRTHTVRSGETLAAIARKYRVSLEALQAANQGVNPKRMQIGQVINVPSQ